MNITNSRYINEYLDLNCSADIQSKKIFPNAKEITESFGAYTAYRKFFSKKYPPDSKKLIIVCPGDGITPRTSALFAYLTEFFCVSVDPALEEKRQKKTKDSKWSNIAHLEYMKEKIQNVFIDPLEEKQKALIVAVHCHVDLNIILKSIRMPIAGIIAIPCCKPLKLSQKDMDKYNLHYVCKYNDSGIWSEKNLVKVWKNAND